MDHFPNRIKRSNTLSVMPRPEILGNKDEIQARIIFFTSMNAHDNIIQGSHRLQWKTSPQSQQPKNLQTPLPLEPQQENIRD